MKSEFILVVIAAPAFAVVGSVYKTKSVRRADSAFVSPKTVGLAILKGEEKAGREDPHDRVG